MMPRLFRIALESSVEAHNLELLCATRGVVVVDVNPEAVVVDPLTMGSRICPVVVLGSKPSDFASLLEVWWTRTGMPGLVIEIKGATVTVLPSIHKPVASVAAVCGGETWEWNGSAESESFHNWASRVLAKLAAESVVPPSSVTLGVAAGDPRAERVRATTDPEFAALYGLSATFVETQAARVAMIGEVWAALVASAPRDNADAARRADATSMRYEPSLALAALTRWSGSYSVRLDLGMLEALAECSRSVLGEVTSTRVLDAVGSAFDEVGIRIAHTLGWLTSVARFPMPTQHAISTAGEQMARELTTGAVLFVLGHELAHVLLDDAAQQSPGMSNHDKELRADRYALELLSSFLESGRSTVVVRSMAGSEAPFAVIVAGAGLFLAFEGLRQLVLATQRGTLQLPWPEQVVEPTATATHPSPFTRLEHLRRIADAVDSSATASSTIQGIEEGFRELWPEIQHNLPEWVMTLPDVVTWIEANGYDLGKADLFVGETLGDMARDDVLELLRSMPKDGDVSAWHINYIEAAVGHSPRSVIDTLAKACVGEGIPVGDPDKSQLQAAALSIVPHLRPTLLRHAVRGSLGGIVHDAAAAAAVGVR